MDLASPPVEMPAAQLAETLANLRARPVLREYSQRRECLDRLEALLKQHQTEMATAINQDFSNRSRHETQLLEFFPALEGLRHTRSHLSRWMKAKRSFASLWFMPARIELKPQPLGVVGIIVPWNYPILLAVAPLVSALAAGNRVMIKMSEITPATGQLFAALIARHFPGNEVVVINGGPETGKAFSALPFDHLLYTGSTAVGHHVMRAAADNLTPLTLELGGKSPAIVGMDYAMELAAERILFGKCLNAGQTCIAPDYVLVPRGRENEFVDAAAQVVARMYPSLRDNPDFTAIVNERHHARLEGLLAEATAQGANIRRFIPAGEDLAGTRKLAPTLVTNVPLDARLMRDEIFGPILPVLPYDTLDSAIRFINERPRPLALYVFSHDSATVDEVLDNTVSGGVTVNDTILHISQEALPFGGVGPSGMGHYHGKFGFDTFSKLKPVFRQSHWNGLKLFHPPFGKRFEALVKFLAR